MEKPTEPKQLSWMERTLKENPLLEKIVNKGVKKISDMQDTMLEQGAFTKDPAGLLQDLMKTYGLTSAQINQPVVGMKEREQQLQAQQQMPQQQMAQPQMPLGGAMGDSAGQQQGSSDEEALELLKSIFGGGQQDQQTQPQQFGVQQQTPQNMGLLQKLMIAGGVGMGAMGGNDAVVSGLMNFLKERQAMQTGQGTGVYGVNPMTGQVSQIAQIHGKTSAPVVRTVYGGQGGSLAGGGGLGSRGEQTEEEGLPGYVDKYTGQFIPEDMEVTGYRKNQKTGAWEPTINKREPTIGEKTQEAFRADVEKQQIISSQNLQVITDAGLDLSQWLSEAYREGGAGRIEKKWKAEFARRGWHRSEQWADQFKSSISVAGKRVEFLNKMFPMLTQQIGKEGTVRLIENIYARLDKTLPDLPSSPNLAIGQIEGSIESMYRITRALYKMFPEATDFESAQLAMLDSYTNNSDAFLNQMAYVESQVVLSKEEKASLKKMQDVATAPIRKYMNSPEYKKQDKVSGTALKIQQSEAKLEALEKILEERRAMGQ